MSSLGDYAHECHDPYDFAALAIRHAIRALLAKTTDRNLQVFRIFEEYISILTERQNESYKGFRDKQHWQGKDDQSEKHVHNREDLHALLELRDIEDGKSNMVSYNDAVTGLPDKCSTYRAQDYQYFDRRAASRGRRIAEAISIPQPGAQERPRRNRLSQ